VQDSRIHEWRTPYGDVHQTGQFAPAPAFLGEAWRADLIDNEFDFPSLLVAPDVARVLAEETRNLFNAVEQQLVARPGLVVMPAVRPLIVNHLLITAGPGSIKAFD